MPLLRAPQRTGRVVLASNESRSFLSLELRIMCFMAAIPSPPLRPSHASSAHSSFGALRFLSRCGKNRGQGTDPPPTRALARITYLNRLSHLLLYGFAMSLLLTVTPAASISVFLRIAVFLPAGAGRPAWTSITGSRSSSTKNPPQPVAPGADQALSTRTLPLRRKIAPFSISSPVPPTPVIGLLGPGGLVVPSVRFQM